MNSTLSAAHQQLCKDYAQSDLGQQFDALRKKEYSRLDATKSVYLDYTASGLYAESQVKRHLENLRQRVLGNPHSQNPSSTASAALIEEARSAILRFFNACKDEYTVIFTSNASTALKLVGESYRFGGKRYLLTFDNHNSVNGIREYARSCGGSVTYLPVTMPDLRIDETTLDLELSRGSSGEHGLFAYPAQSNFSSVQHPLAWIDKAHAQGWDVLLDAAAFVPTNALDLSQWKADFVPVSFYKIFGYPTGIGALLVRNEKLSCLHRPWFSGGTITVASVLGDRYYLSEGAQAFEDGTLDFLNIPAITIGLDYISAIGVENIHQHSMALQAILLAQLAQLSHSNGIALMRLYGPKGIESRGAACAFNLIKPDGTVIDHRMVEAQAAAEGISLRTGCFCNPGAGEIALGLSISEITSCFARPHQDDRLTMEEFRTCISSSSTGAIRVSLGIASNIEDVVHFAKFAQRFLQ